MRRVVWLIALLVIVAPPIGLLAFVALQPVGSAPGLLMGLLLLPAAGISLIGCGVFVASSQDRKRALLSIPVVWIGYIATVPASARIGAWKEEHFLQKHGVDLREIAEELLRKRMTIAEASRALRERGWAVYADEAMGDPTDTVAFVLGGALNDRHGIAFTTTGRRPVALSFGTIQGWQRALDGAYYYWWSG